MSDRQSYSLTKKIEVINLIKSGSKQSDIAKDFGVSKSTINGIWNKRVSILNQFENEEPNRKRIKQCQFSQIDGALLEWFQRQRSNNIPINGPILRAQAIEFAIKFNLEEFKCSEGWLDKWKKRHNIKFRSIAGESQKVDKEVTEDWIQQKWHEIRKGYKPEDIYNCDETGKFWKMLPNKTLHFKNETCSGGSKSKERVTVLLCTNSDGSDKRKLLVIGKFENPRPFKILKSKASLPVEYYFNPKAWMNTKIFENWLKRFDAEMVKKNRNILLTLDNVASHPKNANLKNIKLVYFPANCTSVIQPLDQGIIKNFKIKYQFILVQKILRRLEKGMDAKINLLEAIFAFHAAWNKVLPTTIASCFKHARIEAETFEDSESVMALNEDDNSDYDFSLLCKKAGMHDASSLEECALADEMVFTESYLTDEEIVAKYCAEKDLSQDDEDDDDEDIFATVTKVNADQAMNAVEQLRQWLLNNSDSSHFLQNINEIEQKIQDFRINSQRQPKITQYFSNN